MAEKKADTILDWEIEDESVQVGHAEEKSAQEQSAKERILNLKHALLALFVLVLIAGGSLALSSQTFLPLLLEKIELATVPGLNDISATEFSKIALARAENLPGLLEEAEIEIAELSTFKAEYRDIMVFPDGISGDTVITLDRALPRESSSSEDEDIPLTETGTIDDLTYEISDTQGAFFVTKDANGQILVLHFLADATITFNTPQTAAVLRPFELNQALDN